MKALFHILELDKWGTNVENIRDFLNNDSEASVEVIVASDAAALFGEYSGIDFTDLLENPNVKFTISRKGLEKNNLNLSLLPLGIVVDDFIITKIVRLQQEGYSYIRL